MKLRWLAVLGALACGGCLSKPAVIEVRTFVPAIPTDAATESRMPGLRVRLDRLSSAAYLDEAIVWQRSATEWGRYDDRQWLEKPSHVMQRALERELFERLGCVRVDGKADVAVEVELAHFEEVLAPQHEAHVAVVVTWGGPDGTMRQSTKSARVAIDDDDPATMAQAMGKAIGQVTAEVGALVTGTGDR
ncbi:MAG: membrane integrity-associated transporter subunit PqiC [Planctomycetes bacterium]|nr:membrane integrity-associated transporter subunit PqiC [Planctomycetota bacterium]